MRRIGFVLLFVVALAFAGCGGGLEGTYSDEMGVVTYEFSSDGKVMITGPFGNAVQLDYELEGDRVLVKASEGAAQVLTITPEGHLDIGLAVLKKQDD
ncbi:MAG: hypothetical protein OEM23_04160 [Gemmatimonadota bacterium]|nr:hypothetical protein [Gemmatimonadota bacterium]MDH3427609.1 hypothetical protein [Gemmatimonadota bacterium]